MKQRILTVLLLSCFASPTLAYKTDTHQLISERAVGVSSNYQDFLSEFKLETYRTNGLVMYGSTAEDDASFLLLRYGYHFYDPINEKGLVGFDTAPVWGHSHILNEFSWVEARKAMYDWLIGETTEDREESCKKLFRSLGQVIHLVQDMAQPSHTRNDPHSSHSESIIGSLLLNPSHLEDWALSHGSEVITYANMATGLKTVDTFDDAFETIALYSNQNFFSDDTIFKDYELPSKEETNYTDDFLPFGIGNVAQVLAEDGFIYPVPYIVKTSGVYTGYKLAQVGYFGPELYQHEEFRLLAFLIDDEVAKESAQLLIPQAVAYSTGLLDYFFRGSIDAQADAAGIKITNNSFETMTGTFALL